MEQVNSKQHKLNIGQIIPIFLKNNPQPHPIEVMLPAIITELNQPSVKSKQFGNTVFELIPGKDGQGFFKAFNADTGPNFVENSKMFCVWARRVMNMKTLVTEFTDPSIEQLFKVIAMRPPIPDMGYQVFKAKDGRTRIALNLGV